MIGRRDLLALAGGLLASACRPPPASAPRPVDPPLRIDPVVDLAPAAGLVWLVDARLRELLASPDFAPAFAPVVPAARFDSFAAWHGGVDLRTTTELVVASYGDSLLAVAEVAFDPASVEAAFASRADGVEGRAIEGGVTRTWGSVEGAREQIALLGRQAVAMERGHLGPLRAVEYFARGKLRRAQPALRADPLASAAARLGDAPLRAFAPGPFEGDWSTGLGGLLGATTAVAASAKPMSHGSTPALALELLLMGAWGEDAEAAASRLRAAFDLLTEDPVGRLLGVDKPLEGPRAWQETGALHLSLVLDAVALGRGLYALADASVQEVMKF